MIILFKSLHPFPSPPPRLLMHRVGFLSIDENTQKKKNPRVSSDYDTDILTVTQRLSVNICRQVKRYRRDSGVVWGLCQVSQR